MKTKNEIVRGMVHDKKMKIIIIRLDYAGVTDLNELIKEFDKLHSGSFERRQEAYNNQLNVNLRAEDINSISESISVPINVIRKEKIWRYSGLKDVACETTLDISQYYMCLTIKCEDNYDGLDKYLPIFEETAQNFIQNIPYFLPKRLGLRKNRGEDFKTFDNISKTFEKYLFCLDSFVTECETPLAKKYIDVIGNECKRLQVNLGREIQLLNVAGNLEYKTALDIDAYYTDEQVLSKETMSSLLKVANEYEFDIYKSCMTVEYLNSIM